MAAYAALVSLMNDLELIPNHPAHSFSFDTKQILSLSQTVHSLIDFMESYDSHGCSREAAAQVLESRIASAAHAAHDVIKSHIVDQIHAGSTVGGKHRSYFLLDLRRAIDNMDFVKKKAMQFGAKSGSKAEEQPPTYSEVPMMRKVMVGCDAVLLRLMDKILAVGSFSERVIPIVGMGGIGKTTLAKNVYVHSYVEHHFDVRMWATVSHEYSAETILTQLLRETSSTTGGNASELGVELHKKLYGRRYLVILDDMWRVDAWEQIQRYLPDNGNGSRVIVTTRLSNLAAFLSSSPSEMNFLDEDKSWELFCRKAFGEGEDCPVELEEIGKRIVKRCRELPLSVVVIGGHLRRSSKAVEYWEKVAGYMNPISSLTEDEQCLKVISLSYHQLPIYLKPCFLYMGTFKEDEQIDASVLINYGVAEGFIKPKNGISLEEVAEDFLKDLIDRNLIVVGERRWDGKVEFCVIHDVVRELCLKIGKEEKFIYVHEGTGEGIRRERRVLIPERKKLNSQMVAALESAPLLRSLICQWRFYDKDQLSIVGGKLLRVSVHVYNDKLLKETVTPLSTANFQQINLRYLVFTYTNECTAVSRFTSSPYFPSFWNMQTFIVRTVGVHFREPYEIWEMTQLRHLEFVQLRHLPDPATSKRSNQQACVALGNLHTLLGVLNLRVSEEVCQRMPNLKKLFVSYSYLPYHWEASSYYSLHNLGRFKELEWLTCDFGADCIWRDIVLSIRFPSSLKELCLRNCHLHWEDVAMMIKSLPHLGSLDLGSVHGPEWEVVEVQFPCLRKLIIRNARGLMFWSADSSHFPLLETLHIWHAPKLSEIPYEIGEIPTLRLIDLNCCGVFAAISATKIAMEQESLGNDSLQVDVRFAKRNKVRKFKKMVKENGLVCNGVLVYLGHVEVKIF